MTGGAGRLMAVLLALAALLTPLACSGGDGGSVLPPAAGFQPSGTPASADLVRIEGQPGGDTVLVQVVIDGPSASSDLYSFDLSLEIADPTVAQYVSGSATLGTTLTLSGTQTAAAVAAQNGAIVTLGATKLGGGAGNAVGSGEHTILSLTLRVLRRGATTITIAGLPDFDPAALDSHGSVVPSVRFDLAAASISGV